MWSYNMFVDFTVYVCVRLKDHKLKLIKSVSEFKTSQVADGWTGAALQYYKNTVQQYFTHSYLEVTFKTKRLFFNNISNPPTNRQTWQCVVVCPQWKQ